jgi:hypothetical protein
MEIQADNRTPQIKVFVPTMSESRFLGFVFAAFYHRAKFDIVTLADAHVRLPRVAGRGCSSGATGARSA